MRIGIDAMGGDHAPEVPVRGALAARGLLGGGDKLVLIGDEKALLPLLAAEADWKDTIEVHHASQTVAMDEQPVEAMRTKPDSSISVMSQMHRDGQLDAVISAGNTGACVAAAQMNLRRLPGAHRPGIAIVTPGIAGPVAICDVGANVNCRPQHLHQYAIMASVYLEAIYGVKHPRVATLSVGEEAAKGNDLVKRTHELMNADPSIKFIGNAEGRDLFRGTCDVIVCDGFVGNVVLKLIEGMAECVIKAVVKEMTASNPELALNVRKAAGAIAAKYDYNEYGGAPLLGVNGICIICHGSSDHRGIMNAVRVAADFSKRGVNKRIKQLFSRE